MTLAWLLLLTGLTISGVAIYYSVVGLAAIFSAAVVPIVVMGSALEIAKLVCASWLKANWERAPKFLKLYMTVAVVVLMLITSMGIFGFLSKAHNDQNLVSGDVQSKIAIYDEKIKTAKENIESDRKQLKQMDEAVDQVMSRSSDEKGADKANAIRKSQARDRSALTKDIEANQKLIASLNDEAAPIRAEVRKVEAEVGPLKYIAKFIYGESGADENMLEKAVTWVIILIVIVFDPLAVIMLLAAQMTFAWHRKGHDPLAEEEEVDPYLLHKTVEHTDFVEEPVEQDITQWPFPTPHHSLEKEEHDAEEDIVEEQTHTEEVPANEPSTALGGDITAPEEQQIQDVDPVEQWNAMIEEAEAEVAREQAEAHARKYHPENTIVFPKATFVGQQHTVDQDGEKSTYIYNGTDWVYTPQSGQSEERVKPDLTEVVDVERPGDYLTETESKKKSYMTKDQTGHQELKTRD